MRTTPRTRAALRRMLMGNDLASLARDVEATDLRTVAAATLRAGLLAAEARAATHTAEIAAKQVRERIAQQYEAGEIAAPGATRALPLSRTAAKDAAGRHPAYHRAKDRTARLAYIAEAAEAIHHAGRIFGAALAPAVAAEMTGGWTLTPGAAA